MIKIQYYIKHLQSKNICLHNTEAKEYLTLLQYFGLFFSLLFFLDNRQYLLNNIIFKKLEEYFFQHVNCFYTTPFLLHPVACYSVRTRAGCSHGNVPKQNQDSYICRPNFSGVKNFWLFGTFDGHGLNGHFASDHVKEYFPTNIEMVDILHTKKILERGGSLTSRKVAVQKAIIHGDMELRHDILTEAFIKTNEDIKQRSFNVSFSGTTAVTVFLMGKKLICANVGDSRAILASFKSPSEIHSIPLPAEFSDLDPNEKIWLALPLSRDHKPDDYEEYQRIIQARGRVEPFKEADGEEIGPHRVWLKDENVPGLAMSRSIGDKVAASVGVISEPEIYETELSQDDKFIIIASDGIWEFLPNDVVVEMTVPFWKKNDPEGACKRLIEESLYHWKKEDDVVDDITVIVIFLSIP